MTKEFVPYELAVKLKQLGFDEPCFLYWWKNESGYILADIIYDEVRTLDFKAPLFQQAFRWFREEYNLRGSIMDFIDDEIGIEWDYEIAKIGTDLDENGHYKPLVDYSIDDEDRKFNTYEEAELACLEKFIEIVEGIEPQK
jgi:hypothetical protein